MVNDCSDVETDRINKPFRVLPSGQLSPVAAGWWAMALVAIGLGLSMLLGAVMMLTATVMAVSLYTYSSKLKQSFLVGNAVVSVMSGMTVIYGGMAVGSVGPTLVPAVVILLFMLCREILKTVEDYEGDCQTGARTIAVVWGKMGALRVFRVLAVAVAFLSLLPWALGNVSGAYPIVVIPGISLVLLLAAFVLLRQPDRRRIRIALIATKIDWILWTAAMFIGIGTRI